MPALRLASTGPLPRGLTVAAGLSLCLAVGDASAASLGGTVSSVGVATALVTLVLVKAWQSHPDAGSLSTLAGLFALATGAGLLWHGAGRLRGRGVKGPAHGRSLPRAVSDRGRPLALPMGIEHGALIEELRRHFFELQAAWDQGAREAMSRLTTPDLLDELWAAAPLGASSAHRTDFLTLNAELLLFEERGADQIVCVEFSGMVREAPAVEAAPFREYWMLTRYREKSAGWRLARHQGLM